MARTPIPPVKPQKRSARRSVDAHHSKPSGRNASNKENKNTNSGMEIKEDDLISGRVRLTGGILKASNKKSRSSSVLADKTNTSTARIQSPIVRRLIKSPQKSSSIPRKGIQTRPESNLRYQINPNEEKEQDSESETGSEHEGLLEATLIGEVSRRKSVMSDVKTGRGVDRQVKIRGEATKYRERADGSDGEDENSDTDSSDELPMSQETVNPVEEDDLFVRNIASPEQLQEQLKRRNVALGTAQEKQIQEITEYLGPLCKSIQKLYAKNQKETQSKMLMQCDLWIQATSSELNGLIKLIDDSCAQLVESDKEMEAIQVQLKQAVEKKREVLKQGHRKLRKLEARQLKEMQEDKKQFEDLFATYKAKLTKIEDPAKRQLYLKEKEAHYFMMCDT